jgi:hypothetical protein
VRAEIIRKKVPRLLRAKRDAVVARDVARKALDDLRSCERCSRDLHRAAVALFRRKWRIYRRRMARQTIALRIAKVAGLTYRDL